MIERHFFYRGFEIALQPQRVFQEQSLPDPGEPVVRFRCAVSIREVGPDPAFEEFMLERNGHEPFEDEFDAVVKSCYVAQRRVDLHFASSHRKSDRLRFAALLAAS